MFKIIQNFSVLCLNYFVSKTNKKTRTWSAAGRCIDHFVCRCTWASCGPLLFHSHTLAALLHSHSEHHAHLLNHINLSTTLFRPYRSSSLLHTIQLDPPPTKIAHTPNTFALAPLEDDPGVDGAVFGVGGAVIGVAGADFGVGGAAFLINTPPVKGVDGAALFPGAVSPPA